MEDCIHDMDRDWCALCTGRLQIQAPTRTPEEECCAPNCHQRATTEIGPIPVCVRHARLTEKALMLRLDDVTKRYDKWDKEPNKPQTYTRDWCYFAQIDAVIKIGTSSRLIDRLKTFAQYGQNVILLGIEAGGRNLEGRLHRRFSEYRTTEAGLSVELFHPHEDIIAYVAEGRSCATLACKHNAAPLRVVCQQHAHHKYPEEALIGHAITRLNLEHAGYGPLT